MITLEEVTKELTPAQKKAFMSLLNKGESASAYSLGVKMATMRALEKKGLVRGRWRGTPVMAEINYEWRSVYKVS